MLILKNITKDYVTSSETVHALGGVDISFRDREFVSILGPSGCGKTTLLNIIGGLDRYTSGDLEINGKSTKLFRDRDWDVYRNHRVGFIFQSYNLIPHQTVLGNVELALTIAGLGREERIKKAKAALDKVGLSGQYYKRPNQLSGGQCQRVAIARALVNDPEILLADEPTGALDTVTSVQIMDLIKEIAGERLVIMVTHNPELAEKYSTRIIRLLDGRVLEDTNPVSAEEAEKIEAEERQARALLEKEEENARAKAEEKGKKQKKQRNREKAKMSFLTAFRLSARNLISKKGRTTMVGIAGSIGIIGIAMVLAFSAGIKGYVASMQDDMLSGNPITITETTYDLTALTGMMDMAQDTVKNKQPGHAYINSLVEYIAKMSDTRDATIIQNDINEDYVNFVTSMPKEYYNAMLLEYGIDMTHSIYTNYEGGFSDGKNEKTVSIAALTEMYTAVLNGTKFSDYASFVTQIAPTFEQAPNNEDYIRSQYDVYGEIADEAGEVMIVLDGNQKLTDMLLARLGYYTEEEFFNIIYKATGDERYNPDLDVKSFTFDELMSEDKTFVWYPNDAIYEKNDSFTAQMNPFHYKHNAEDINSNDGVELKVVGVLMTNETTTYGCLQSGIYYTEALTKHILETNKDSEIVSYVEEKGDITSMMYNGMPVGIYYEIDYTSLQEDENGKNIVVRGHKALVGEQYGIEDMMSSIAGGSGESQNGSGGMGGAGSFDLSTIKTVSARSLGGVDLANAISIYPLSFDSKNLVTDYLDKWNSDEDLTVGDKVLPGTGEGARLDVTYTDTLELIINLINGMIDVVSYALIAFTSISLVVSTVMIGIITYVSVVERIKEIGVIRSLGGRKKDVSRLFMAETFIIGLLAGIIGIGVTYGISAIASAIVFSLTGIPNIALLPVSNAFILIALSVGLTLISGLMPARSAAKKDPVIALRTE